MRIHRQRNKTHPLLKILLCLVLIIGVSFMLAWVWHTTEQTVVAEQPSVSPAAETSAVSVAEEPSVSEPEAEEPELSEPEESGAESEGAETDGDGEEPASTRVVFEGAVPESPAVDNTYFDDAIFFGDSISTGIPLYHIADNAAVVAMTGINTGNINYKECIDVGDGKRVTVLEAAKQYGERSKVYIMLGGNGIGFDKETFISGYRAFVQSVKEMYPGAVIYLQSMTPVVEGYVNEFDPEMDNDKIDEYNLEIQALAKEQGVCYLDVASAFKNENGVLPTEASPVDGLHFTPEYYNKWFEYLKTHTIATEETK